MTVILFGKVVMTAVAVLLLRDVYTDVRCWWKIEKKWRNKYVR